MTARVLRRIAFGLAAALVLACSEPTSGPVRIVWGRHACDHCAMAINDARYAAQIRTGPREVVRFDEFGCAVIWLADHPEAKPVEFWVMDMDTEQWLDAGEARYRAGQRTPMAHGFAAIAAAEPGALDFEAARAAVLATRRERAAHGQP